jgi:hypothetical protein
VIEDTLISNILDRIWEMTKKPLEYPRNNTKLNPFNICSNSEHGEHNGNGQLTKDMNGQHGDGQMQK